jgi:adenosylcobinamide-phosphate synthase
VIVEAFTPFLILPAAFILDLAIGDPQFSHHPIRYMGRAIEKLEPPFRRIPFSPDVSGALFVTVLVSTTFLTTFILIKTARELHPILGILLEILMLYFCISCKALKDAALSVYAALKSGDLPEARKRLSFIVSRDVSRLSASDVSKATVETVSENLVDGVMSPLFYAALGGAPLAMTFKMISTIDSMIGYKNDRYLKFGKAGARLDDLANYVPARLATVIITISAHMLGGIGLRTWKTAFSEGSHHDSPNAGYPEAAFAGALGVRLGGPGVYHGIRVEKPFLGGAFGPARPDHIPKACQLMTLSSLVALTLLFSLSMGVFGI